MSGALEVAAIGMRAQQAALEAIASNVSNVNTPAFKRADLRFSALIDSGGTQGNLFVDRVSGVAQTEVPDLDRAGQLYATSNYKDVAINGSGFIELMGPAGQTYLWRGGTLRILEDGQLATPNGFALRANVVLPAGATDLRIDPDGKVFSQGSADTQPSQIGTIPLVRLEDGARVTRLDGGVYALVNTDGLAPRFTEVVAGEDGTGTLVQSSLERSNVDLNNEMVDLLISQRAYAANAQVVRAADEFLSVANGLRR